MINGALYKREMKNSLRLLFLLAAVITMYAVLIISMYDPEMMAMLDGIVDMMPELMAAVGMSTGAKDLISFMISYLYGFIFLLFPMIFTIVRGNALVAGYVDRGAMVSLLAAPVKRRTIALTQMAALLSGILILVGYSTAVEIVSAEYFFPGALNRKALIALNCGLLQLHLFIGGIVFLASCACSDVKRSLGFGAGIPILMYVLQMLANVGGKVEKVKYATFFTLFDPYGLVNKEAVAMLGVGALLVGAVILYFMAVEIFYDKNLFI